MAAADPTTVPTVLNHAVRAAAEQMTDGAITAALLADVAAMRGLPLRIPASAQTEAQRRAIDARIAADAAVDRARGAENARRRHAAVLAANARGEGVAVYVNLAGDPVRVTVSRHAVAAARAFLPAEMAAA
jgi:hypothetical protein